MLSHHSQRNAAFLKQDGSPESTLYEHAASLILDRHNIMLLAALLCIIDDEIIESVDFFLIGALAQLQQVCVLVAACPVGRLDQDRNERTLGIARRLQMAT